ncbi:ankyrin repeat-containing domain protein [Pelagophyceae sp. CCMP2097]|nr:ankyrin repeat-containing domain protein [Pelagophyceae sp. CCMP2097]
MQALLQQQKAALRIKQDLQNGAEIPVTPIDRANALRRKQFGGGAQLFATQYTTVHACAETDNLAGLMHFLDKKTEIDVQDRSGSSCLIIAAERGFDGFVLALLQRGADPTVRNSKSQTAAHAAAVGGHRNILRQLCAAGAELSDRDATGATPAHYAAQLDDAETLRTLHECQEDLVAEGIAADGALETPMNNGMLPAHTAALFDSPAALRFLHSVGCDLNRQDRDGETPMHKAARVQALRALAFLRAIHDIDGARNAEGDTADDLFCDNTRYWALA